MTPFPHQEEAVKIIDKFNGRALLADDMGLGKSLTSMLWVHRNKHKAFPLIIVCPATLKWNWQKECKKHFGWDVHVLESKTVNKNYLKNKKYIIINYDILTDWVPVLQTMKFKTIILDECQALISKTSMRTKACKKLCQSIPYIIATSGTPFTSVPYQIWPILNILRADLFPTSFAFGMKYCGAKKKPWGWEFKSATRTEELNKLLLDNLMIRRKKEDILKNMSKKVEKIVRIPITNYEEYKLAYDDFLRWMYMKNPTKLSSAERAEQLVKIGYLFRLVGELKIKGICRWIDKFMKKHRSEKLMVYVSHTKIIEALHDKYRNISTMVNGSVIGKKRQQAFDKFLKDSKVRLFFGNIQAAGKGLSATSVSHIAFAELCWKPGDLEQCKDRIRGINRGDDSKNSNIYYLLSKDTIEQHILKVLQTKKDRFDAIIDNKKYDSNVNIYEMFTESVLKYEEKKKAAKGHPKVIHNNKKNTNNTKN